MNPFDSALFPLLNRGAANPVFDWIMPRITNLHHLPGFLVVAAILLLWMLVKGDRRMRIWAGCLVLSISLSDLSAARIVKNLAHRDRPCKIVSVAGALAYPDTRLVEGEHCPGSASFPSNHAANMMALATVCWWFSRRKSVGVPEEAISQTRRNWKPFLWFLFPVVIGYSRVYLGYHYPTDVLGGYLLGGGVASIILAIGSRYIRPNSIELAEILPSPNEA